MSLMKKHILDVVQTMELLGLDSAGLSRAVRNEGLLAFRLAGEIKFRHSDVEDWIGKQAKKNSVADETDEELLRLIGVSIESVATRAKNPGSPVEFDKLISGHSMPEFTGNVSTKDLEKSKESKTTESIDSVLNEKKPPKQDIDNDTISSIPIIVDEIESSDDSILLFDSFSIKFAVFDTMFCIAPSIKPDSDAFNILENTTNDLNLKIADFNLLKKQLCQYPGKWVKVADTSNPFSGRAKVIVSNDGMTAYLLISAIDENTHIALADIEEALSAEGVVEGIDMDTARHLVEKKVFGQLAVIAVGKKPTPGEDARIEYKFDVEKTISPKAIESGRVDFKNLDGITNVKTGDILAVKFEAGPGSPGKDVRGRIIEAPSGKDILMLPGDNVIVSEDGLELSASADGNVFVRGGRVNVNNVYVVQGDVDYSCGNIDFSGVVIVRGSIREGFSVSADSSVFINDGVEGASVESRNADITIRLGVQGQNKATLKAAGDISAKYINQATVAAGGDVSTQEAIMLSNVKAGGSIKALGAKGCIIGGNLSACNTIEAVSLGSDSHTKTFLTLEMTDDETAMPVRTSLNRRKNSLESEAKKLSAEIERIKKRIDKRNPEKKLIQSAAELTRKLKCLEKEKQSIYEDINYFNSRFGISGTRFIRAMDMVYPQVIINIEGNKHRIENNQRRSTFCCDIEDDHAVICREI